jgi:hypothetical protein
MELFAARHLWHLKRKANELAPVLAASFEDSVSAK